MDARNNHVCHHLDLLVMTFLLKATLTHKSFKEPIVKEMRYTGDTFDDILAQIRGHDVPMALLDRLRHHRTTGFKDSHGVKHEWVLKEVDTHH